MIPATFLILALLGCSDQPDWLRCADAECRQVGLISAFSDAPHEVMARLLTFDPLEQQAHVRELVRAYPNSAQWICEQFPEGEVADACARDMARPHLAQGFQSRLPDMGQRSAPGPAERHPPPPSPGAAPWVEATREELTASLQGCDPVGDCDSVAGKHAADGDLESATLACAAAHRGDELARQECLFRVAEGVAKTTGDLKMAASLCALSGTFATGCMHHCMVFSMPQVAPADGMGRDAAEDAIQGAGRLHESLGSGPLAGYHGDQYWAVWTAAAWEESETLTAAPLQGLPGDVLPHVRMALAWRMVRDLPAEDVAHLDPLVDQLSKVLAQKHDVLPDTSTRRAAVPVRKYEDYWPDDQGELESAIPSAYCLGPGRRPFSTDEEVDLQLVVLEAAARRSEPAPESLWLEAADPSRHLWVRWTASRIATQLYPQLVLPDDPEELVQARRKSSGTRE